MALTTKPTKTDTARSRCLNMVSIPQHIRTPHSHYTEEICDNVVLTIATLVKEVRDYPISPSKPFRKPGTENSSFIFPSQLPTEHEANVNFKLCTSSSSISPYWGRTGKEKKADLQMRPRDHRASAQMVVWMLARGLFIKGVQGNTDKPSV